MKMIIHKHDIPELIGKFIIQLTTIQEEVGRTILNEENWSFFKEKRISFVCRGENGRIELQGFYYRHRAFETDEEFMDYFNNYDTEGSRFHRLLTNKEIDFLCNKLKERNNL